MARTLALAISLSPSQGTAPTSAKAVIMDSGTLHCSVGIPSTHLDARSPISHQPSNCPRCGAAPRTSTRAIIGKLGYFPFVLSNTPDARSLHLASAISLFRSQEAASGSRPVRSPMEREVTSRIGRIALLVSGSSILINVVANGARSHVSCQPCRCSVSESSTKSGPMRSPMARASASAITLSQSQGTASHFRPAWSLMARTSRRPSRCPHRRKQRLTCDQHGH